MSSREVYNHIGWRVFKTTNNKYGLSYERNIINEDSALIEISEEVFNEAKEPYCSLHELYEKFDLDKCKVLGRLGKPITIKKINKNTRNKFYGHGYIVEKTDNGFFLSYQLDRHGGGIREFEITEKIYLYARNSNLSTTDLFKKFDLYKYDIPENDVK